MTRDEVKDIQMIIQAAYPNYNPPDKAITINTWLELLGDYTYEQVLAAVYAFIRTDRKGFAPSIGEIMEKLQLLFGERELNEEEAWAMVLKALRNSGYHAEEEYGKLPRPIQIAIASPKRLEELALMQNMNVTVESSNFKRVYRTVIETERDIQKLPQNLQRLANKNRDRLENPKLIKAISASEEREQAIKQARPMPETARMKLERIMRNDNSIK